MKSRINTHNRLGSMLNFRTSVSILIMIFTIMFFSQTLTAQSFILDIQGETMSFTNAQRTIIANTGNSGTNAGSVHKYSNVITKDGVTVYALLTIKERNNATITNFDDDNITGEQTRFQPRIGTGSGGGYIVYEIEFFNTADDESVFVFNYNLTGVDIDGNNSSNREYVEVGGYTSYTVNNPTGLTVSTNNNTGRTRFLGISNSLPGVTFDNSAAFIANYLNANNKISFALGQTSSNTERFYSVQIGVAGGVFSNPIIINNPLPVAIDDVGTPVNSSTGGVAINNVLDNDLFDGASVVPSEVNISQVTNPSHPGIVFNTTTGQVTVAPGTPGGVYTFVYQICMVSAPSDCDVATVTVKVLEADLAIQKVVNLNPVNAGEQLEYTITVTNNGPTEAYDVVVEDILPAGLSVVSTNPSKGSWSAPFWMIGTLNNGASATLIILTNIDGSYSGALSNTATVSSSTYDPDMDNNTATAETVVIAPNGPVAQDDNASTTMNTPVDINVLNNDTEGDVALNPSTVSFVIGTVPDAATEGVFTVNGNTGLVTFTPAAGFVGTVTIDYQVCDLNGLCDIATITVEVTQVITGPTAHDDNASTLINTAVDILALNNDAPGSAALNPAALTFVAGTGPNATTQGVFTVDNATGIVTFTPANNFVGTVSIDYQICDLNANCDIATITVDVIVGASNLYPAFGPGTLAFEDLWPAKGDYDFNDLVIDYQFEVLSNPTNFVEQVVATFTIKAFGASFENGFGFQLNQNIDAGDLTVTGYDLTENMITLNANGTEAGQLKPTIIVFDNAYAQMAHPGVGIGVNTEPNAPYVAPKTLTITIGFKPNTYTINNLAISNFNPFLIVNKDRAVEVHLPNYPPTDLADHSKFGVWDDDSDAGTGKYYLTANNLPWAINIYERFDYPIEKQDITWVHLKFAEWAVSSGVLFPNWYQNITGYRNAGLIYTPPSN